MLQRNLRVKSVAIKTLAYQTYVRPRAEYASCVWSPHTVSDSHQVEMVQRTAARWVLSRHDRTSSVTDMLSELKWRSLEQRRADTALTMLYKIRNGHLLTSPTHLTPVTGILTSAQHNPFKVTPTPKVTVFSHLTIDGYIEPKTSFSVLLWVYACIFLCIT